MDFVKNDVYITQKKGTSSDEENNFSPETVPLKYLSAIYQHISAIYQYILNEAKKGIHILLNQAR